MRVSGLTISIALVGLAGCPATRPSGPISSERDRAVTARPPTPGLAVVQRCGDAAPALVQSSGDPADDAALLAAPAPSAKPGRDGCVVVTAYRVAPGAPPSGGTDRVVPPNELEAARLDGPRAIFPADPVKLAIFHDHLSRLVIPIRVCIDASGKVDAVSIIKTTGYLGYELDLINAIATWHYRPFEIDGAAAAVCSVVQFNYNQDTDEAGGPWHFGDKGAR